MTDKEVEEKFRKLASRSMDEDRMRLITETVYQLEDLDDIGKLMQMLVLKNNRNSLAL